MPPDRPQTVANKAILQFLTILWNLKNCSGLISRGLGLGVAHTCTAEVTPCNALAWCDRGDGDLQNGTFNGLAVIFCTINAPVCTARPLAFSGPVCYNLTMGRKARPLMFAAAATSGTGGAALLPSEALFSTVSGPLGSLYIKPRRRYLGPFEGMKKGRRLSRRPHLKLFHNPSLVYGFIPHKTSHFPPRWRVFLYFPALSWFIPVFLNILSPYTGTTAKNAG